MSKIKCLLCGTVLETFSEEITCSCINYSNIEVKDGHAIIGGEDLSKVHIWRDSYEEFQELVM